MLLTGNLLQASVLFSEMTHLGTPLSDRSSEQALISDILGGNTAGFESLIATYQGRVFATARKYARKESEVEDIVQEIFIKAFRKLDSYRMDAPFEHWLMKIAIRTCYDYLRKHQRSRMASFTDIQKEDFDLLEVCGEDETDARHQREAAKALVHNLLDALKPASRLVLILQEIEGKSVKEIAQLTGWSTALVKVRAFRARKEMRKLLEKINLDAY